MKGLILAIVLGAVPAYGQTVPQVTDALASIRARDNSLNQCYENMLGMADGQDTSVLASAIDFINLMRVSDTGVVAVANLVTHMRDPADLQYVRAQLQYTLGNALFVSDLSVKAINGYMALLKAPAAVAEVTKARDEMIAIREVLRSLKDGSPASAPPQ